MGGFGGSGGGVDWQQFYVPSTVNFGETQASVDAENAEKRRQAMLMAAQINQANATTSGMNAQAGMANTTASNLANANNSTGSFADITSGGYSLPGLSMNGTFAGGPATYTSIPGGGVSGTGTNPLSTQVQQQYDPWSQYRDEAGTQLANQMGQPSPSDIYQQKLAQMSTGQFTPDDPSYQWRYNQGQQAVERSLAARGLLNSGNAGIELQQYGQGAASQEYGAQFNRMLQGLAGSEDAYNTQMSRLMSMAGVNIDPTAGGQLAVQTGNLGVAQGQLGVNASQVASNYDLGMRELRLKQQLAQMAQANQSVGNMTGTNWSAIFGQGG